MKLSSLILALGLLCLSVAAQARPSQQEVLQLVDGFVQENYSYGDDGIDCATEVHSLKLIQEDAGVLHSGPAYLYEFSTQQEVERHGCGIKLSCHALVRKGRDEGRLQLDWAHCQN